MQRRDLQNRRLPVRFLSHLPLIRREYKPTHALATGSAFWCPGPFVRKIVRYWRKVSTTDTVSHHTVVVCCPAKLRDNHENRKPFYKRMMRGRLNDRQEANQADFYYLMA
jgi:hypothetical protein